MKYKNRGKVSFFRHISDQLKLSRCRKTHFRCRGRVVATQDGVQRASNQWILTRYNAFDEETERYLSAAFTRATIEAAFSSSAYPQSIYGAAGNTLLLQRQYGGTRPQGAPAFSAVSGVITADSLSNSNAGRVVWEKVYDNNTSNGYAERSFFYDARGRLRQSVERDPLEGTLRTSVLPDYIGNALRTVTSYTIEQSTFAEETTNTYDNRGRVLTSVTSAQGASAKTTNAYDALGRVKGADYGLRNRSGMCVSLVQGVVHRHRGWQDNARIRLTGDVAAHDGVCLTTVTGARTRHPKKPKIFRGPRGRA